MIYNLINLCYHIIGLRETQVEVKENTADLEVKLEWLIVKTMTVWKFLLSQKSNFLCDQ